MDDVHARELLTQERERLGVIREDIQHEGEIDYDEAQDVEQETFGQHPADVATEESDQARDIGMLEQVEGELKDIEDALRRIDEGTYGRCEVCGRPIPDERLEALPTARFDVEHEPRGDGERPPL